MDQEDSRVRAEPSPNGRRRFARRRLGMIIGVVVLISLAGAWFYLGSFPPRDLGLLAAGRLFFGPSESRAPSRSTFGGLGPPPMAPRFGS